MSKTETGSKCVAQCRSCSEVFPAILRADGSLRPIGVAECNCGSDDFRRMSI